jgi:hypothetical protein
MMPLATTNLHDACANHIRETHLMRTQLEVSAWYNAIEHNGTLHRSRPVSSHQYNVARGCLKLGRLVVGLLVLGDEQHHKIQLSAVSTSAFL